MENLSHRIRQIRPRRDTTAKHEQQAASDCEQRGKAFHCRTPFAASSFAKKNSATDCIKKATSQTQASAQSRTGCPASDSDKKMQEHSKKPCDGFTASLLSHQSAGIPDAIAGHGPLSRPPARPAASVSLGPLAWLARYL
jgi:hypothetical protein